MADYLLQPKGVTTSEAPRSSITPGQVASPFTEMANVLNKTGEVLNDVAVNAAEKAGYEAGDNAKPGPDGKVAPVDAPIIGPASVAFSRAARFSEMAKLQPEIENRLTEIKLEHRDDPAGFKAASDAYVQGVREKYSDPSIRAGAMKAAQDTAGSYYRQTLVEADNANAQNALVSMKSTLSDKSNRLADLAFNGKQDSDDYRQTASDIKTIYSQLAADPRMKYPQARVDSELREMDAQNTVHTIAGSAIRMMDTDSPTARADAKKFLVDKIYGDPNLNLSMAQRHQAVTTAMGLMEARSAENKALIDGNKAITTSLINQLQSTQAYNPIQVHDAIDKARKIGDAESFYKLTYAQGMHDWDSTVRTLPLPQQLAAARGLENASPLEGRLMASESSGNPHKVNQLGYAGLYQFGAPRLADLGVYTPGPNEDLKGWSKTGRDAPGKWTGTFNVPNHPEVKTITDFLNNPDAQRAVYGAHQGKMDQEIKTLGLDKFEGQTVGGVAINRNALYGMMHLGGAQGTLDALSSGGANAARDANGTSVMDYAKRFSAGGGAGQAWFDEARIEQVKRFRTYLGTQAPAMVDTFIKQVNAAGDVPVADLKNLNDVLQQTGRADLRGKVDEALMAHYGVKDLDGVPQADRQAWVTQTSQAAAQDGLTFRVHQHMAESIAANAKAMADTPYSAWAVRTSSPPPATYNFDDPNQVTGVAAKRVALQKAFRNNDRTAPTSVFEGKEAESFATSLTSGDPGKAAQALTGLGTLPDDVYQATLAQKPITDAVTSMMSSKDPARMSAGMSAVDKLWRTNPADAQTAFGASAITKLQAWQALKDSFNGPELAERLNAADDPSTVKARETAKEAAEKETSSLSPSDMAYNMGTGWPGIGRLTGSTPSVPFDSIKGGEMVADYKATYTALRTYGVDADRASELAVKRLGATWGISEAAGNQIMKNPPERSYPAIDGSHAWLDQDLKSWVSKRAGSEVGSQFTSNLSAADAAMQLTPEERALYQRHVANLTGPGGVDNEDGTRSTIFQTTVEHEGKFYTIPTVFDGKILWDKGASDPAAAAVEMVKQIGWEKFPSYKSEAEAEARYQQMHVFMEKDTAVFKGSRGSRRSLEMGAFAGAERNWSVEGLISDGQTEAEIKAGRPPSYQVAIKRRDGTHEIISSRIAFDPSDHIEKYGNSLDQRRQVVDFLRAQPFSNSMPQP